MFVRGWASCGVHSSSWRTTKQVVKFFLLRPQVNTNNIATTHTGPPEMDGVKTSGELINRLINFAYPILPGSARSCIYRYLLAEVVEMGLT